MQSRMIVTLLSMLALAVCGTASAVINYHPRPLNEVMTQATVVAHVRITRIEDRQFRFQGKMITCGTDYFVDVLETFKGRPVRQRSFSFGGQPHGAFWLVVQPGDEMLVLLQPRRLNSYPSAALSDVIGPPPTPSESACFRTLSPWTLWNDTAGGFRLMVPQGTPTGADVPLQFLYVDHRIRLPPTLQGLEARYNRMCDNCFTPMMVPWTLMRDEIRNWTRKP